MGHLQRDLPSPGASSAGVWTSALFVGQFVCPLVVLAPTGALGGLGAALALLGAVVVVAVGVGLTRPVAVAAAH